MLVTAEQFVALMPDATELLSEEPEVESTLHHSQAVLLEKLLEWFWQDRQDFFIGVNLTIYFSHEELKNREFRGPDFFLVLDTERRPRTSWVVWEEGGKYPDLIIELLSPSTEEIDREIKKEIYQDRFRTPEYFWFSPITLEFEGWRLAARRYRPIPANEKGWRWSEVLGMYLGVSDDRLRYFTADGEMIPTPEEDARRAILAALEAQHLAEQERERAEQEKQRAEQEKQRAEQERQHAEQEKQRAEQAESRAASLAARLRELGLDPEQL